MSRNKPSHLGSSALLATALLAGAGPLAADPGSWQVGLDFGRSSLESNFGRQHVKRFDDDAEATSVEVTYSFNRYFGLQAGYHDLGSFQGVGSPCPDGADACIERFANQPLALCVDGAPCVEVLAPIEAEVTGWSLAVVPSWPLGEHLSAFARLGVLDWEAELSSDIRAPGSRRNFEDFSGTDLLTAIGLSYRFGEHLGAAAEVRRTDLDLSSASLGVHWRF